MVSKNNVLQCNQNAKLFLDLETQEDMVNTFPLSHCTRTLHSFNSSTSCIILFTLLLGKCILWNNAILYTCVWLVMCWMYKIRYVYWYHQSVVHTITFHWMLFSRIECCSILLRVFVTINWCYISWILSESRTTKKWDFTLILHAGSSGFCLPWERISTTSAISVLRNYGKRKHFLYYSVLNKSNTSGVKNITVVYNVLALPHSREWVVIWGTMVNGIAF